MNKALKDLYGSDTPKKPLKQPYKIIEAKPALKKAFWYGWIWGVIIMVPTMLVVFAIMFASFIVEMEQKYDLIYQGICM